MKHFTIKLFDENRQTRAWSLWADQLTVGSDPRCALVLPAPAAPLLGVFSHDARLELPFGILDVFEDTSFKGTLWESARERIARSRKLVSRDPGEHLERARTAVLSLLGILAVASMVALVRIGQRPLPPAGTEDLPPFITLVLPPEDKKDPPPVPKDDEQSPATSDKPQPGPAGGPSESRTQAWQTQSSPRDVMDGSVMSQMDANADALAGELTDDTQPSAVDVILAGDAGNKLVKGAKGGPAGGDGDRMQASGGFGLGYSGRAGVGPGRGSIEGRMHAGAGGPGTGAALRPHVSAPRPSDVELGGDAGSRSPESILRVIRQGMGGFRYVYEKYLRDNPNLGGKISLRFTIAPSGDIIQIAVVSSNTGDESLDGTLMGQAKRMKFDAIEKGNVTVTYAFLLDKQ